MATRSRLEAVLGALDSPHAQNNTEDSTVSVFRIDSEIVSKIASEISSEIDSEIDCEIDG